MSERPKTPYEDPQLLEEAHGDQRLLDRLVALDIAQGRLDEDPDNESTRRLIEFMQAEVYARKVELGLLPPEETP